MANTNILLTDSDAKQIGGIFVRRVIIEGDEFEPDIEGDEYSLPSGGLCLVNVRRTPN